jgi:hypothetical protein
VTTSERVVDILVGEGGYRELPNPFKVGSIPFEFTHALVAGDKANDLVIVIELKGDTADDAVIRKVLALTRALDVMRSKRPVTAVLTSGQARSETVQTITNVCRVLPVGAPSGPDALNTLRDWLSVLLPLKESVVVNTTLDWEGDLRRAVPNPTKNALIDKLVGAAPHGEMAVEGVLARAIVNSVEPSLQEGEDD